MSTYFVIVCSPEHQQTIWQKIDPYKRNDDVSDLSIIKQSFHVERINGDVRNTQQHLESLNSTWGNFLFIPCLCKNTMLDDGK